jgi:selenide,water dikinase
VSPLLSDPQTAGGLLAGVSEARVEACVAALHRLGYEHASVIGTVVAIEPGERPLRLETQLSARAARAMAAAD